MKESTTRLHVGLLVFANVANDRRRIKLTIVMLRHSIFVSDEFAIYM